jgi:hypothetical protein
MNSLEAAVIPSFYPFNIIYGGTYYYYSGSFYSIASLVY